MRAKEFITEIKLDIPNQMVTVQVPLSDLIAGDVPDSNGIKVNPGKRAGQDGKYKWSPPLQQHLDSVKDSVGPSNDDIVADPEDDTADSSPQLHKQKNTALISRTPSALG